MVFINNQADIHTTGTNEELHYEIVTKRVMVFDEELLKPSHTTTPVYRVISGQSEDGLPFHVIIKQEPAPDLEGIEDFLTRYYAAKDKTGIPVPDYIESFTIVYSLESDLNKDAYHLSGFKRENCPVTV